MLSERPVTSCVSVGTSQRTLLLKREYVAEERTTEDRDYEETALLADAKISRRLGSDRFCRRLGEMSLFALHVGMPNRDDCPRIHVALSR